MIKNITRLEHKIGDRIYHFFCDADSPLGEVHDALCTFKAKAIDIMKSAQEAESQKEAPAKEAPAQENTP